MCGARSKAHALVQNGKINSTRPPSQRICIAFPTVLLPLGFTLKHLPIQESIICSAGLMPQKNETSFYAH